MATQVCTPRTLEAGEPDVVQRAAGLRNRLRSRAGETDALARLPDATVRDLEETGLFELTKPRRYGGLQAGVRTYMDAMVELGRGDVSASWVGTIINISNWFAVTLFPRETCDEVFATPGARVAAVLQPRSCKVRRVEGGFHVEEGLWAFNSGVHHAQWDMLGFSVPSEDGSRQQEAFALLPVEQVQILDDWDTIGVRGSGSSSVSVRDAFIPDARVALTEATRSGERSLPWSGEDWLYRCALTPLGQIVLSFPALGAGLAALDIFMEQLPKRGIAATPYRRQIEAPVTHIQLGEASAKIDAARAVIANAAAEIERDARAGVVMEYLTRARIRRDTGFADRQIWEGVDLLVDASGGSFASVSHPLTRIWHDVRVASLHATLVPTSVYELYGRLLCGLDARGMNV